MAASKWPFLFFLLSRPCSLARVRSLHSTLSYSSLLNPSPVEKKRLPHEIGVTRTVNAAGGSPPT